MTAAPGKRSLLVVFLTVFIDLLGFGIVLPLLPIYAQDFTLDESGLQLGLLMASFSAMQFLCAPAWGRLSDRIGRRPVILVGLAGSVVFYSLFGWATVLRSLPLLFVSRIGAGVAGATISTAHAYIADSTSLANRSKGMALIGMAFGLGFTFGPLLGYLAVPTGTGAPGPGPGCAAAGLSAVALVLAWFLLPESLRPDSRPAERAWLHVASLRSALTTPLIRALLVAIFVCVFSIAKLETTLAMLIKGKVSGNTAFAFTFQQVCLTFAYIGLVLAVVQGLLVRRLAGRVSEGSFARAGAALEVVGFLLLTVAIDRHATWLLFLALTLVVAGFGCLTPALNSLLSRRSDPARQGGILGVGQSVSALARILGSGIGIPLLKIGATLPFYTAAGLMALGLWLIARAVRGGRDFSASGDDHLSKA